MQRHSEGVCASSSSLLRSERLPPLSTAPLHDALRPVLPLFQPFLTDADAARLLRTSRTTALTLLPCYTFRTHTFDIASAASLQTLSDLCLAYQLRIIRLRLEQHAEPLEPGALPAGLTHLDVGYRFDQPFRVGVLPASLLHLDLGTFYVHPLPAGVIPSGVLQVLLTEQYVGPGRGIWRLQLRPELVLPPGAQATWLEEVYRGYRWEGPNERR